MSAFRKLIIRLGGSLHPLSIIAILVALNVSWGTTLSMFGRQFEAVAGWQPIDLQNTSSILTGTQALEQIATYSIDAKSLYWSFFILDNIMPPLVFGAFSLLWVYFLRRREGLFFQRLLNSPALLIPFGVGFFDWIENLCFIVAITTYPDASALPVMEIGLVFVRFKVLCIFATFIGTALLTVYHVVATLRQFFNKRTQPQFVRS